MRRRLAWVVTMGLALVACGGSDNGSGGETGGGGTGTGTGMGTGAGTTTAPSYDVSGDVVDFQTGMPVDMATLSVSGVIPAPSVTVTGSSFTVEGVPTDSIVQMLAGAPPSYEPTYDVPLEVTADVTGLEVAVVATSYVDELKAAFGAPAGGVLLAQATDASGNPLADVSAAAFDVEGGTGPFFLDDAMAPQLNASATSASGWVVFMGLPDGLVGLSAAMGSGVTFVGPQVQVASGAVSVLTFEVQDGEQPIPVNVSFSGDVVPIFTKRGCDNCHSGNSIGADLGELALNGGDNKIHSELTDEISETYGQLRVDVDIPDKSLVLRLPSLEDPPDNHPNATFASPSDPDYLTLLGWITEGAKNN